MRAEHQRFDFIVIEHQWRQREARPQHVTETGFAFDRRALRLQTGDVAVERAQADTEFACQDLAIHWMAAAAQQLHEIKQADGARQRALR